MAFSSADWVLSGLIVLNIAIQLILKFFTSYFDQKGFNSAQKEDLAELTSLVKEVEVKLEQRLQEVIKGIELQNSKQFELSRLQIQGIIDFSKAISDYRADAFDADPKHGKHGADEMLLFCDRLLNTKKVFFERADLLDVFNISYNKEVQLEFVTTVFSQEENIRDLIPHRLEFDEKRRLFNQNQIASNEMKAAISVWQEKLKSYRKVKIELYKSSLKASGELKQSLSVALKEVITKISQ